MKKKYSTGKIAYIIIFLCISWFGTAVTWAADRYVVPTNTLAALPFTNWGIAATNIQDAVNAATNGEKVWITNGVYFCQGISTAIIDTTNTAMVVVTNAITVRSLDNNYSGTIVNGYFPAWTTRVFYVNNTGAVISGLTITNGFTTNLSGVGVYMMNGLLTNCLVTGNVLSNETSSTLGAGVQMVTGTISHCVIRGNRTLGSPSSCNQIAGLYCGYAGSGTISNCLISQNSIGKGTIYGDTCKLYYGSYRMQNCAVYNNSAGSAINLASAFLGWSVISNNSDAGVYLGEAATIRNCMIITNGRYGVAVGRNGGKLGNCVVVGHWVRGIDAGECRSDVNYSFENNILYYNAVGAVNPTYGNWYSTNITYTNCCTYPLPTNALGQVMATNTVTNAPLFVDIPAGNWRLQNISPCVNAGANRPWMTNSVDLDGSVRIRYGNVDIGAYEMIYNGTIYTSW